MLIQAEHPTARRNVERRIERRKLAIGMYAPSVRLAPRGALAFGSIAAIAPRSVSSIVRTPPLCAAQP
jgi:hypothetical protein